jgi:AcrR family transcriptional regulator
MGAQTSVRDRILQTAGDLFYREGVRAVGVDLIVEQSGVAKTSLYRHFATKDDLIAAFVERENTEYWENWDKVASRHPDDPVGELDAQLAAIGRHIVEPGYRGCPFLNVANEFPEREHPARIAATKNKPELHRRLRLLAERIGALDPQSLADQLVLLIDGAYANAALFGRKGPARSLVPAARSLIDAALASRKPTRRGRQIR